MKMIIQKPRTLLEFVEKLWTLFRKNLYGLSFGLISAPPPNDFDMSDCQREHAASIEELVPSLQALREKICSHLSNGQFWMIYFILLLPRLNETDMELLTSEIIRARDTLLQKLLKKKNALVESSESEAGQASEVDAENLPKAGETSSQHMHVSPKTSNAYGETQEVEIEKFGANVESEAACPFKSSFARNRSENMEDVSFSDLEDNNNDLSDRLPGLRLAQSARASSASE